MCTLKDHLFTLTNIPQNPESKPQGLCFSKALFEGLIFWTGLYSEGLIYGGKFAFQNRDWANLIVGRKFTVFALFYFVFEGNFPSTSPQGLIFGGAI